MSLSNYGYNPETELQMAIELIIKAFEKKTLNTSQEVNHLRETIKLKDEKISEYENTLDNFNREFRMMREEIEKLKGENNYLIEICQRLNEENSKLLRFKKVIVTSLEADTNILNINKTQLAEFLEGKNYMPATATATETEKECKSGKNINLNINGSNFHLNNSTSEIKLGLNSENLFSRNNSVINTYNGIKSNKNSVKDSPINDIFMKLNTKFMNNSFNLEDHNHNENKNNENINNYNYKTAIPIKPTVSNRFDLRVKEIKSKIKNEMNLQNKPYKDYKLTDDDVIQQNDRNYDNKSPHYIKASKFFHECKIALSDTDYEELINIFSRKNTDLNCSRRIEEILENHQKLLKDFRNTFHNYLK